MNYKNMKNLLDDVSLSKEEFVKLKNYSDKNFDSKHNKRVPLFDPETALARKRNAINLIVEKI